MKSLILALFLISSPAYAYYDVLDTGEVLAKGNYRLLGGAQFLTDHGGLNVNAGFDMGFDEEFGIRGQFGFGETDIFAGGYLKWVPVPDIEGQPAIGARLGLLYAKDSVLRELAFRLEPFVSKKFDLQSTIWTPYAALPVGIANRDVDQVGKKSEVTWQLVVGTQLQVEKWKKLQFIAEVGTDLDNALSHFSIGALLYFDEYGIAIE